MWCQWLATAQQTLLEDKKEAHVFIVNTKFAGSISKTDILAFSQVIYCLELETKLFKLPVVLKCIEGKKNLLIVKGLVCIHSTVKNGWVQKQVRGPHHGGISRLENKQTIETIESVFMMYICVFIFPPLSFAYHPLWEMC